MADPGTRDGQPVLAFGTQEEWREWLAANGEASGGVWLKLARKGSGVASVTHDEALDVALCFGWIDGRKEKLDGEHWLQKLTPRAPRSRWSKINVDKATALVAAGRMRPAGLRAIDAAKADGRWQAAYAPASRATVPDDLARALDGNAEARRFFATLDGANRYAILWRVHDAKKPETRARRIAEFVAMLARGETLHPPRKARAATAGRSAAPARTAPPAARPRGAAPSSRRASRRSE